MISNRLQYDRITLRSYLSAVSTNRFRPAVADGRHVISISLYSREQRYLWGAIRNAQLVPIHLPSWTLRVYVSSTSTLPPQRILTKLRLLGAQIVRVPDAVAATVGAQHWRLLAADDRTLDYFLVRNADWRLSEREAAAVGEWVKAAEADGERNSSSDAAVAAVHCIRDAGYHANHGLVEGLWGAKARQLHQLLNATNFVQFAAAQMASIDGANASAHIGSWQRVLDDVVWPAVSGHAYCHDVVSPCPRWPPSTSRHGFLVERRDRSEFVGVRFNEHEQPDNSTDHVTSGDDIIC
jgi:hypothetical protein